MANYFNELAIQTALRAGLLAELKNTETRIVEISRKLMSTLGMSTENDGGAPAELPAKRRGRKPKAASPVVEPTTVEEATEEPSGPGVDTEDERLADNEEAIARGTLRGEILKLMSPGLEMTGKDLLAVCHDAGVVDNPDLQPSVRRDFGNALKDLAAAGAVRMVRKDKVTTYCRVE
jgi:hypothetical protein